jgi:acetolactate synthase-1/2/3 large subunit
VTDDSKKKSTLSDDLDDRIYGSDIIADALREQGFPYICLNPGASYRGLHDSLVNYLGNHTPEIITCMHEEHAVGIAQGYAKITDKALAVAVHSNVGLMHASMGVFNAWCDRVPMLILGATGPLDAAIRRPWIEWIHTAIDQGSMVEALQNGTISRHHQKRLLKQFAVA